MSDVSLIVPLPLEQMMCPTGPHEAFRAAETGVLDELPIGGVIRARSTPTENAPPRAAT